VERSRVKPGTRKANVDEEMEMPGKLNHLAITTDHYTVLGMFYRAAFGMKVSGDTAREIGAISVGDGYVGMTLIPRRGGRKAGLDHFGIEVEDLEKVRGKVAKKYPDIEIVKRPGNRPFASYSAHDPAGNYFDLSQPGHENRAEVYSRGEWKQDTTISHFALRAREAERLAGFYVDLFELEARNLPSEEGGYFLTDGRVTMSIVPWKISSFNGAGIEQPAMDHIGFRTPDLGAFKASLDQLAKTNIGLAPKPIDFDSEGAARLALLRKCPLGSFQLADPDGTLIDVAEDH
jgi:predicted enzyme related to lactoylglutathione lyase